MLLSFVIAFQQITVARFFKIEAQLFDKKMSNIRTSTNTQLLATSAKPAYSLSDTSKTSTLVSATTKKRFVFTFMFLKMLSFVLRTGCAMFKAHCASPCNQKNPKPVHSGPLCLVNTIKLLKLACLKCIMCPMRPAFFKQVRHQNRNFNFFKHISS